MPSELGYVFASASLPSCKVISNALQVRAQICLGYSHQFIMPSELGLEYTSANRNASSNALRVKARIPRLIVLALREC